MSIGISWGCALKHCAMSSNRPDYSDYYNVTVVQMVGCPGTGNPSVDGLEFASVFQCVPSTYSNIYAPVYVT